MARARFLAFSALVCLGELACSTSPEIVATYREQPIEDSGAPDAPLFHDVPLIEGCAPGRYTGEFKSQNYQDGARGLILRGNIDFSLVESQDHEFLQIEPGSVLSGKDNDTGAVFTASVLADSACQVGEFSVALVEGLYTFPGLPPFPFTGEVSGTYFQEPEDRRANGSTASGYFAGDWRALSGSDPSGTVVAWGRWVAYPDD